MGMIDEMMEALSGMQGGTHVWLVQALHGVAGDPDQPGPGLHTVLDKLEQAGYGDIVKSWIARGPNLPIDPNQLHKALGDQEVQAMAGRAHLTPDELVGKLSQHLPGVVDRLSPEGKLSV